MADHDSKCGWFWLIVSLLSAFSMWHYVNYVWSAGQPAQFSDLYARWWGARELLLHHRDPYSVEVSREIQTVIYGAPQAAANAGYPDQQAGGFAYPAYVVFLMWPTVRLPFPVVRMIFAYLLPLFTLLSLALWVYVLNWRPGLSRLAVVSIFLLGSFPFLQGLKLQNLSLLVAFLVAAAIACLVAGRFALAGVLLALASIKPHFVFLLVLWLVMWTVHDWSRRQRLAWGFLTVQALLLLGSEMLSPGWISRFWKVAQAYRQYTYGHSLLDVWLSPRFGPYAAAVLVLAVLILCWPCRSCETRTSGFFLATSLVLATTLVVIPTLEPHAQLLLLPGFLFLLKYRREIWHSSRETRLLVLSAWILPAWAWTAAMAMTLAATWLPGEALQRHWILPLSTSPLIPCGALLVLALLLHRQTGSSRSQEV